MDRRLPSVTVLLLLLATLLSAGCQGPALSSPDNKPGSWRDYPLSDLRGKGNFTISTFAGKTVLVPVVSTDCPPCTDLLIRQLDELGRLPGVPGGDPVVVALDLNSGPGPGFVAGYAPGFTTAGYSARSPDSQALALLKTFGPFSIDSNTVPVILVCPDSHELLLPTGVKTAERLAASIAAEC